MTMQSYDPAQALANLMNMTPEKMRELLVNTSFSPPAEPEGEPRAPADMFQASRELFQMQQDWWKQVSNWWLGLGGMAPGASAASGAPAAANDDKRFAGEAWNDPRFDAVKRTYRAMSKLMEDAAEQLQLDDRAKDQLRFQVRQMIDAMSPSNFLATNPDAMQLAIETGGKSLTEGANLFLQDLLKGRISTTDEGAFEVGRNLAVTPGSVIHENEIMQVIQYAPTGALVRERPLVIVPPCINKFYILDLQPENSFVRHAVDEGYTVFLVSWRNITPELGHYTWDDYVQKGVMEAIDVALNVSGAERVNTLGFCIGGTLLASTLGVLKARGDDTVSSMTLLTAMLDFSDTGEIGALISDQAVQAREAAIGKGGVMQGKELGFTFSCLRSNDLIWQYVVNSYLKGKAPPAFDILFWNSESTNLPGPMFCWYLRNTYLENKLRVPGGTVQCGVPVDLSQVDVPAFIYASREDHIVPWRTAYESVNVLGGETTFVLGASGHIAGVVNPPAKGKRNYWTGGKPGPDADAWMAGAQSVKGSWWPAWSRWLSDHAGRWVPARETLGNERHPPIEAAPGRYVRTVE